MEKNVLSGLEPKGVFTFFEQLCRIPHGSGNTAAASAWAAEFARSRGLRLRQDAVGNVIIWKDASPGYEDHPAVMLQGHLDMVCVKDSGVSHDFLKDPLDLYVDGDWIKARGSTLGGDDGIAVAMALAVLDSGAIPHPPLTAGISSAISLSSKNCRVSLTIFGLICAQTRARKDVLTSSSISPQIAFGYNCHA